MSRRKERCVGASGARSGLKGVEGLVKRCVRRSSSVLMSVQSVSKHKVIASAVVYKADTPRGDDSAVYGAIAAATPHTVLCVTYTARPQRSKHDRQEIVRPGAALVTPYALSTCGKLRR